MARTASPTSTPVTAANRSVWCVRRPMARASACRCVGSGDRDVSMDGEVRTHPPRHWHRPRWARADSRTAVDSVPCDTWRVEPRRHGGYHPRMKKLLLLVVIAALATLATKKVRAA